MVFERKIDEFVEDLTKISLVGEQNSLISSSNQHIG